MGKTSCSRHNSCESHQNFHACQRQLLATQVDQDRDSPAVLHVQFISVLVLVAQFVSMDIVLESDPQRLLCNTTVYTGVLCLGM